MQLNELFRRFRRSSIDDQKTSQDTSNLPTDDSNQTGGALGPVVLQSANEIFVRGNECLFSGNLQEAVKWLEKAAFHSVPSPKAMGVLAFLHEFAIGAEQNFAKAEQLYLLAAQSNDGLACARLAFLRKYGRPSVKIDRVEAEMWARKVDEIPDALEWLRYAADVQNLPAAHYAYGVSHHDGIGTKKDPVKAVYYYQKAADLGQARGEGILGYCYGEGFGVEKDESKAFDLYLSAAYKGESVSMYNVAHCYEDGIGVQRSVPDAILWYKRSAELGNCYAQNSLGYIYEEGLGVEQNPETAVHYYRLSSNQGYPWAQCNL